MVVLGLCIGEFSSAALVIDGQLAGASYEERFHRKKCYSGFPHESIRFLLAHAGIRANEIDRVAVMNETLCGLEYALVQRLHSFSVADYVEEAHGFYKPRLYENQKVRYLDLFERKIQRTVFSADIADRVMEEGETKENSQPIRCDLIRRALERNDVDISFVEHHLSHALYGLLFAPADAQRPLIFTADSFGDYSNATVYELTNGSLDLIHSSGDQNLGRLFRNMTLLLGMKPYQHEYKVMGLAPYAAPAYARQVANLFAEYMTGFKDGKWHFAKSPKDHYFEFQKRLEGVRFDTIAGGLQQYFEDRLAEWFEYYVAKSPGTDSVIFSGGLSMNVKANMRLGKIAAEHGKRFYPAPSGDDWSHCISVAYATLLESGNKLTEFTRPGRLTALDQGYPFSESDTTAVVEWAKQAGWSIAATDATAIAKSLSAGKIYALCHGRAEFGARALGFRSIIADPSDFDTVRRINVAIKQRDFWMPFAPAILEGHESDYLEIDDPATHRFMGSAARCTAAGRARLRAAVHPYDHTARPQIVSRAQNPLFARLIEAFGKATGTYALLNTSLNLHGYPIVNDAADLIHVLENSALDGVILDDLVVTRSENQQ